MIKKQLEFAEGFRTGAVPTLVGTHFIDEAHSNRHARLLHMHEDVMELFYVYSGEGQYMVDGCSYHVKQGDIIICNAGILHGEEPSQKRSMRSYSIAIKDIRVKGLPDNFLTEETGNPVINCGLLAEQIGQMMKLIYSLYFKQGHLEQVCDHITCSVLLLVYDLLSSRKRHEKNRINIKANLLAHRIQQYLDRHYSEPLTLQSISAALNVSEYYLAHVFKDELGMPPMQYVMKRRMGEAQTLLMDTDLPIAEISELIGYGNPWNFSTAFNRCVGMSPSKYRKSFKEMDEVKP